LILKIKVITKSSQNKIVGFEGDVLKIKCTAVPEKGKANEVVIGLLAKHYKVPKSALSILKGHTSSKKTIEMKEG